MLMHLMGFGFVFGLLTAPSLAHAQSQSDHQGHGSQSEAIAGHGDGKHHHSKVIQLPTGPTAPTLDFVIAKDEVGGWNLHIQTTNFRFAPENVNGATHDGEGHAHIYVNGEKIARVYGPWFHIGSLPEGRNEVAVTLNANDHSGLAVGDAVLSVAKEVHVPSAPAPTAVAQDGPQQVIEARIKDRKIVAPDEAIRITEGDKIELRWTSDEAVALHLHGYDVELHVGPEEPAVMVIEAHATGRFPITSHGWGEGGDGHEALTYLEVYPR